MHCPAREYCARASCALSTSSLVGETRRLPRCEESLKRFLSSRVTRLYAWRLSRFPSRHIWSSVRRLIYEVEVGSELRNAFDTLLEHCLENFPQERIDQ